jgi:hypothetical protein
MSTSAFSIAPIACALSPPAAFLAFGHCLPGTTILLGCETSEQLAANLKAWRDTEPLRQDVERLARDIPELPERVLNPVCWPAG